MEMENMAKAEIVETLYPLTATDEAIRDLWCHILSTVAPFLTNRTEVDILLFEELEVCCSWLQFAERSSR